jgi:hypothetical protein
MPALNDDPPDEDEDDSDDPPRCSCLVLLLLAAVADELRPVPHLASLRGFFTHRSLLPLTDARRLQGSPADAPPPMVSSGGGTGTLWCLLSLSSLSLQMDGAEQPSLLLLLPVSCARGRAWWCCPWPWLFLHEKRLLSANL